MLEAIDLSQLIRACIGSYLSGCVAFDLGDAIDGFLSAGDQIELVLWREVLSVLRQPLLVSPRQRPHLVIEDVSRSVYSLRRSQVSRLIYKLSWPRLYALSLLLGQPSRRWSLVFGHSLFFRRFNRSAGIDAAGWHLISVSTPTGDIW